MATRYWTNGASDGDLNNILNWDGAAAIPVAGDSMVFGVGGTDISISFTTPFSVANITFTNGFSGNVITPAGAAIVLSTAVTGTLKYAGKGARALFSFSGTVALARFEHGGGQIVGLAAGTYTNLINGMAMLTIDAACVVCSGGGTQLTNQGGQLTVAYNATAIGGEIINSAGTTIVRRNFADALVNAGTVIQTDNGTSNICKATGNIRVGTGGVYNKQSTDTDTSKAFITLGGTYTMLGNTGTQTGTVNVGTVTFYSGSVSGLNVAPGITIAGTINYYGGVAGSPSPSR